MIDQSLIKSNFVGRDGFRWWIGQVAPVTSQDSQFNKSGWGNRCKVRIMGYHPHDETELSNDDLPWSQILLSTSDGSGASNYATNTKIRPGDIVFGFFLDGDNAQIPVVIGCFGRTDKIPNQSSDFVSPFVPFTGFTNRIENDGSRLKSDQTNEQKPHTQTSPYHLPPQVANRINQISYYSGIGDNLQLASIKPGSKIDKISTEIENAIKYLQDLKSYPNLAKNWIGVKTQELCDQVSEKIQGVTTEIVGSIVNDTYEKLIPPLNQGSKALYDSVFQTVYSSTSSISAAHLAAAESQKSTIGPVKELQKLIPCLIANIIKSLGSIISDMVCSLLENVANFVSCAIDQFVSGIVNAILDLVISGMSSVLGVLSLLLSFTNFNLEKSVREGAESLLGIPISLNCGEEEENSENSIQKWTIGSGNDQSSSFNVNKILDLANNAFALANSSDGELSSLESVVGPLDFLSSNISDPNFNSVLSNCYGGTPTSCNPPTIRIFGGGGSGAAAVPIFGSVSGSTASIIGAIVTSSGSGYSTPPAVRIKDNCGRGYGANAKSIIKNGKVIAIVMNSDGEKYPVGNYPKPTASQITPTITSIIVENPGYNYDQNDIVTDNFGNEYDVLIDEGSIVSVTPINIKQVTDLPIIRVKSKTGSGARLKPVFGFTEKIEVEDLELLIKEGKVKQVIDCIN